MRGPRRGFRFRAITAGLCLSLCGAVLFAQDPPPGGEAMPKAARGKARRGGGKGAPKSGEMTKKDEAPKPAEPKATPPADPASGIVFSRDVAPILVGNCVGCHNPRTKARNGGLDLTTFQAMMDGGKDGKVVVAGDPENSPLVVLVANQEMPRGNRGKLSEEAVGKLQQWVKDGAVLDAKADPRAPLEKFAASPADVRRNALAKLSPEQRDKKLEEVAQERWKKASATADPPVATPGKNFIVFGALPRERAEKVLKTMEAQRQKLGSILGRDGAKALTGPEKISLYVFKSPASYVEFVRSVESREVETGVEAHGRLDVEQPYVAAVDPLNGGPEPAASSRKSGRSKKGSEEAADGPERSLDGLLSEGLASSAALAAGKPPRWLVSGLGAYLAMPVDPRGSGYYGKLRDAARQQFELGWETKANEALGGEGDPETIRALGFSLCEWMATEARPQFPQFLQNMTAGGEKLDEAIRASFGEQASRQEFLMHWGNFIGTRYGARRR